MAESSKGASAPAKICVRCGRDCAGRPRSKDARGRYVCGECIEAVRKARTDGVFVYGEGPMPGPDASQDEEPRRRQALPLDRAGEAEAEAAIPLAVDDAIPLDADPATVREPAGGPVTCKGCGLLMAAGAVLCTSCGFDTRINSAHAGPAQAGPKCPACGYSLVGLKGKQCPECGAATAGPGRRLAVEKKAAHDAVREAYTKPLLMLGIGLAISVVGAMIGSASLTGGLWAAAGYLIKYAIYVPIGVLVFLGCCLVWIGFNAPVHLTALRLAGIYAVTDATALVVGLIPFPFIPWLILVTVYVGLLQDMLELDLIDAAVVGLVTFIVRTVLLLTVAAYVGRALGF